MNPQTRRPHILGEVERASYASVVGSDAWAANTSAATSKPLLITEVPQLQRLGALWTDAWIAEKIGDHLVDLDYSEDGVFPGGARAYNGTTRRKMQLPIDQVIERVRAGGTAEAPDSRLYVYGANPRPFERLLEDYAVPTELIGEFVEMHTQFWLGGEGATTPAHFDVADNLLGQVRGSKEVLLWSPDDYPHLYVNPTNARHERNSNLGSLQDVDYERFPRFAKARALSCTLEAGAMLYIPLGWFHYVRTTEFTVSVNHFWHSPQMMTFLQSGLHFLRGEVRPELMSLMIHLMMERQGFVPRTLVEPTSLPIAGTPCLP
jgi:hypothetical protein